MMNSFKQEGLHGIATKTRISISMDQPLMFWLDLVL